MVTYTPDPGVLACRTGDDTVLLDTTSGTYFQLDAVGSWVWERLVDGAEPRQLAVALLAECAPGTAPSPDVVHADVVELVAELVGRGLLSPSAT